MELETFLSFLKPYREVLFKSGTAQYLRQINHFGRIRSFHASLYFQQSTGGFLLIPSSIKDLVFNRGKGGGEENQHTRKAKAFTSTLMLQLQPATFCPKLLSGCPVGVVGQVFQTTFLHLGPGCRCSAHFSIQPSPCPEASCSCWHFITFFLSPSPSSDLHSSCSAPGLQRATQNRAITGKGSWQAKIRSIIKTGATPTCSSWLCYANTNCLASGLSCIMAGQRESMGPAPLIPISQQLRKSWPLRRLLLTHGESLHAGTIKQPWRAEIKFALTLRPCYALGAAWRGLCTTWSQVHYICILL